MSQLHAWITFLRENNNNDNKLKRKREKRKGGEREIINNVIPGAIRVIEDLKTKGNKEENGIFQGIFSELLGGRARAPRTCPFATRICLALKHFHRSNFPQECDT